MFRRNGFKTRLLIGLGFALFAIVQYCSKADKNPVTGKTEYVSYSPDEEIALGLNAAPQMAQQYGGLSANAEATKLVKYVGDKIVNNSEAKELPYRYDFHLLADPQTVNAFALPGGQIFITEGLLSRLTTEDQLAGVLAHEVGHVVARHSSQQMAKQELTSGLTGAAVMASGDYSSTYAAQMINNMINMKFSRSDELESDELGVRFMTEAGYNPEALIEVMQILEKAGGGNRPPEFQSTHPSSENRIAAIKEAIQKYKNPTGSF